MQALQLVTPSLGMNGSRFRDMYMHVAEPGRASSIATVPMSALLCFTRYWLVLEVVVCCVIVAVLCRKYLVIRQRATFVHKVAPMQSDDIWRTARYDHGCRAVIEELSKRPATLVESG